MMAIAAWLVWKKGGFKLNTPPLRLFIIQLALNAAWTPLFFGLRNPLLGAIDILVLWVFLVLTVRAFFKVSTVAGWLLVPYLLWVTFAAALNIEIWRLN
jgi:translocator protein